MDKQAHTPGPWLYISRDEWSHMIVTQHGELPSGEPSYWTVAEVNKNREPEHKANARLIAAAPDLLEALQAFMATDPSFTKASEKTLREMIVEGTRLAHPVLLAKLAIARATGEAL